MRRHVSLRHGHDAPRQVGESFETRRGVVIASAHVGAAVMIRNHDA
jgi:hypothetical protein